MMEGILDNIFSASIYICLIAMVVRVIDLVEEMD
jgi:hypothetical protein